MKFIKQLIYFKLMICFLKTKQKMKNYEKCVKINLNKGKNWGKK